MAKPVKRSARKPTRVRKASPAAPKAAASTIESELINPPTEDYLRAGIAAWWLQRGEKHFVLQLLRSGKPLPAEVCQVLADYLEGKFQRRAGRPGRTEDRKDELACDCVNSRALLEQLKKQGNTHIEAIALMAKKRGLSEKRMEHILYPGKEIQAIADSLLELARPSCRP